MNLTIKEAERQLLINALNRHIARLQLMAREAQDNGVEAAFTAIHAEIDQSIALRDRLHEFPRPAA